MGPNQSGFFLSKYSNLDTASTQSKQQQINARKRWYSIGQDGWWCSEHTSSLLLPRIDNQHGQDNLWRGADYLKKGKSGGALHRILASNWWAVKWYLNGAKMFAFTDAVQLNHYKTLQVASFMLLHLCFRSLFLVTKGQMWSEPWCSSPRALLYSAATSLWPKSPLQNRRTETTLNVLALEGANCRRKGTPDAKGDEKMKSLFRCCWERSQAAPPRQPWQLPRDVAALDIRQRTE